MRFPSGGEHPARAGCDETLSYTAFPCEHWMLLRTNDVLERIMREIFLRTSVVGAFPEGQSALMLVAARLRYVAGTRWRKRVNLDTERLRDHNLFPADHFGRGESCCGDLTLRPVD